MLTKKEDIEKRTEELLQPIVDAHQFELVDVEFVKEGGNRYLRAYIDKPGGIAVNDCEVISRAFSDVLDREDYIEESYIFEVSSPGLGRPLKKDKDFQRSLGKDVEIRLYRPRNHQKEFTGRLVDFDGQSVTIEEENGEKTVFDKAEIALIRLAFDF